MMIKQVISLLFLMPLQMLALPYSIDIWQSDQGKVHFINDVHIDTGIPGVIDANKEQADYALTYAMNKNMPIVIENAFDYPHINQLDAVLSQKIMSFLEPRFSKAHLKQFIHLVKADTHNLVYNVEHRQLRGPGQTDPALYELDRALVNAVITEIEHYNDNELLNGVYHEITQSIKKIDPNNQEGIDRLYYDAQLLDARIMHYIYSQHHSPALWPWGWLWNIKEFFFPVSQDLIIAVGGYHSQRVQELLPALGYEKLSSAGRECRMFDGAPVADNFKQKCNNDGFCFIDEKNKVAVAPLALNTVLIA